MKRKEIKVESKVRGMHLEAVMCDAGLKRSNMQQHCVYAYLWLFGKRRVEVFLHLNKSILTEVIMI